MEPLTGEPRTPIVTPLRRISTPGGDVRHAIKASDATFDGFGEAYFTEVLQGAVKGWKRHRRMTMNLVVAEGEVRFIVQEGADRHAFQLSPDRPASHNRLTVPAGCWMAFGGVGAGRNLLLNLANIEHDPSEAESAPLDRFPWSWTR